MCYGNSDNNLERSLWFALTSTEYIAITQGMSIIKVTIGDQLQCLAGKTYEFGTHRWSTRHMSKQYDILESVLENILEEPSLFTNQQYIMNIFSESKAILLPFRDFLQYKYEQNMHQCIRDGLVTSKLCLH